ncbi:MAG: energy transducer TonB [Porticoccaceae bacterium]|nr:energy transducer TonB [Porticoccaceae bacterium]
MKRVKMFVAAAALLSATGAFAASGPYEVEVTGLPGLSINSGKTVWQPIPLYPRMALRHGVTGEVLVQYSINEQGKAENIQILESSAKGFFDDTTIRALENATFGLAYEQGSTVAVHGVKKRFIYNIEKVSDREQRLQVSVN